jgi:hypothetical protein
MMNNAMIATDETNARALYEAVKATRSAQYSRRIAAHEVGGHAYVGRALGTNVDFVTILPSGGYAGRCVRRGAPSSQLNLLAPTPAPTTTQLVDICASIGAPQIGSRRVEIAEEMARAMIMITELVSGSVCERIMYPDLLALGAEHDMIEARALASVVCSSPGAIGAMLAYAEAEAEALIRAHLPVVTALIDQLVEHGTLSGEQVDEIISGAIAAEIVAAEHQRRRKWDEAVKNAAIFAAQIKE